MRLLTFLIVVFILLSSTFFPLPPALAAVQLTVVQTVWGSPSTPIEVGPGDSAVPMSIVIQNIGDETITALRAELLFHGRITDSAGRAVATSYIDATLSPGRTAAFPFTVSVDPTAVIGSYGFTMTVRYLIQRGTTYVEGEALRYVVTVDLLGRVDIEATSNPTILTPDTTNRITISIANRGSGGASNLEATLALPSGVSLEGSSSTQRLGNLRASSSSSLNYSIFIPASFASSSIQLPLSFTYRDAYGTQRSVTRIVSLRVSSERSSIAVVDTFWSSPSSTKEAEPGEKGAGLTAVLQNSGTNPVTGLRASLFLEKPFSTPQGGDVAESYSSATVQPGATASLPFTVSIEKEAEVRDYVFKMELSYLIVKGTLVEQGEPLRFDVKVFLPGKVVLDISSIQSSIKPGVVNVFQAMLSNVGSGKGTDFEVSMSVPPGVTFIGHENHWLISSLKPGERVNLTSQIYVPSTLAGSALQFTLSITYKDASGSPRTVTRLIGAKVSTEEATSIVVTGTSWGSPSSPSEVGPGESSILFVSLQNMGTNPISGITTQIILVEPLYNSTKGSVARASYGLTLQPGQIGSLQFNLVVGENAKVGNHELTLSLDYLIQRGSVFTRAEERRKVSVFVSGKPDIYISFEKNSVTAGSVNEVNIVIENRGSREAISAELALSFPPTLSLLGSEGRFSFPSLQPGKPEKVKLAIFASPTSSNTLAQVSVSIARKDPFGATRSSSSSLGIRILPPSTQSLEVAARSSLLTAETLTEVEVSMKNAAGFKLRSLVVTVSLPPALSLVSKSNVFDLGELEPKKEVLFRMPIFALTPASGSSLQVQLFISYHDDQQVPKSETHVLGFLVGGWTSPLTVAVEPTSLFAGVTNEPKIKLRNEGVSTLQSLSVVMTLPTVTGGVSPIILASRSNNWEFGKVGTKEEVSLTPQLFASLEAMDNTYQAQLQLIYKDALGISHSEMRSIGFLVKGKARLEVTNLQLVPSAALQGDTFTVTGSILNKGASSALFTTLSSRRSEIFLPSEDGGSTYLGEVVTNTPLSFSFTPRISRRAANGTYPLTLVFTYEDRYGEASQAEVRVNVTVGGAIPVRTPRATTQQEGQASFSPEIITRPPWSYVAIALVFIAIFLLYLRASRKRMERLRRRIGGNP